MAEAVTVSYTVSDFSWFHEVLVRTRDLVSELHSENLSEDAEKKLHVLAATLNDPRAEDDTVGP